ncbi:MAG: transposase [Proteobacteria bacterium]|nr:transposase [Pseudomonadota bacterium]
MSPKGWHARGYLPHFDSPETVQFVTFGLSDSLPAKLAAPYVPGTKSLLEMDTHLDAGRGACWLGNKAVANEVQVALRHFDGERYRLLAWCIMPNHVHVVIEPEDQHNLGSIVQSWKSFTAKRANKLLGRSGPFWRKDYFDRYMRGEEHYAKTVAYVEDNPVKAGLCGTATEWPWSSAAFRA